jgi:hypothetical protein
MEQAGLVLSELTLNDITPGYDSKLVQFESIPLPELPHQALQMMLIRERLNTLQREAEIIALKDPLPRDHVIEKMQERLDVSDDKWKELDDIFGLKDNNEDERTIAYAHKLQKSFEFYTSILKMYIDTYGTEVLEKHQAG